MFLRDAPIGVQQLVLYDGALFFGDDPRYRMKWTAASRRDPWQSILHQEDGIKHLLGALEVFCAVRGASLAVLELTGVPLGPPQRRGGGVASTPSLHLLLSLARCLPPLVSLQRLHLASVGLRNGLRDNRLIALLLQRRAAKQQRRQAVALRIFDLSQNPLLVGLGGGGASEGHASAMTPLAAATERWQHSRRLSPDSGSGASLLTVLCEALQQGLVLRTLRLRAMGLRKDSLRPLLQMLYREVAHKQAGLHSEFPLEEVSLEGNPLDPEFPNAIAIALQQLADQPPMADAWPSRPLSSAPPPPAAHAASGQYSIAAPPRARSMPVLPSERGRESSPVDIDRDAVSDCSADEDFEPASDLRSRALLRERLAKECAHLASRLDERGESEGCSRRSDPRIGSGHSSTYGGIPLGHIPNRSHECGYARDGRFPDLLSDSEPNESDSGSVDDGEGADAFADCEKATLGGGQAAHGFGRPAAPCSGDASAQQTRNEPHAKLNMLHRLFNESDAREMPHMLQYALEAVNSDTSLTDMKAFEEQQRVERQRMAELLEDEDDSARGGGGHGAGGPFALPSMMRANSM